MGRRSRKRAASPAGEARTTTTARPEKPAPRGREDNMTRGYAKAEAKREEIRQDLEPLAPGERPKWVTISAVVAMVLAIANLTGGLIDPPEGQQAIATFAFPVILIIASIGMWKVKYWAVLGFQAALAFELLITSLALIAVEVWWKGLLLVVLIGLLGLVFYKLVRAMARLQMPR